MKNILGLLLMPILVPILIISTVLEVVYVTGGEIFECFENILYNIRK